MKICHFTVNRSLWSRLGRRDFQRSGRPGLPSPSAGTNPRLADAQRNAPLRFERRRADHHGESHQEMTAVAPAVEAAKTKLQSMDKFLITGGNPLEGEIAVSGAKNSALPALARAFTDEEVTLHRVPRVRDIATIGKVASSHWSARRCNGQHGSYQGRHVRSARGSLRSASKRDAVRFCHSWPF